MAASCCVGRVAAGNSCCSDKVVVSNICCNVEAASGCWAECAEGLAAATA